ncbi:MAG: sensor histidine kinase [Faecalicoccus sp.]|nr:sensor histidine kinase [Faecalicoccus sp.]
MNKLKSFLISEYKVFFCLVFSILVYGSIFVLRNLDMEYFLLGLKILIFGWIVYMMIQWFNYQKQISLKEELEKVKRENHRLESQIIEDRKDLEEYFLLWVHQIKTPITVSKLLLEKEDTPSSKKLKEQMFYIEEYTNMAIDYLKLKDRQADMDITLVDLDAIIKNLLKKCSMLFIEKHLSLEYEPVKTQVVSDTKWLSILIEQILSNAVKYTEHGKIRIWFENDTLMIRDTGIGIRFEDIPKIFDRGYSGFNGRVNEKSSGLGLYLVKNIAELLNIEVTVSSALNQGSTFSVHFNNLSKL